MTNRYNSRMRELLELQAANMPEPGEPHITVEPDADDAPVTPRSRRSKFGRVLSRAAKPFKRYGKYVSKNAKRASRDVKKGWKAAIGAEGIENRARAKHSAATKKADAAYNQASGKGIRQWAGGMARAGYGAARYVTSPLFESELIEMGVNSYDLDNYDYYLIEGKKGSKLYRKAKAFVKKGVRGAKKGLKNLKAGIKHDVKDIKKKAGAVGKEIGSIVKSTYSNKEARKRMSRNLSPEDKAKGKEHKKAIRASKVKKGAAIAEALLEHSEVMMNASDGSAQMVDLVRAAMNGEPATTQDLFKNVMAEKLAAAMNAYREVAAEDMFDGEPSEVDYEDFEDAELVAEWTEEGPEDEDEFEDEEGFDDDFVDEDEDNSEEDN